MKPIRLLSLFSGIGAFEKALSRLNIPFEVVNYCEIDRYPAKAYSILHNIPEEKNLWDVKKIDLESLPDFDLLTWGFPCFEKGVLVMTDKGYKPIEEIKAGDMVLTHANRFQKVVKPMKHYCDQLYEIQIYGAEKFRVTEEHPFYVRERKYVWDNQKRRYVRQFSEPEWVPASKLSKGHFIGVTVNQKSELPDWKGYAYMHHKTEKRVNELDFANPRLWWIIGRFMRDGWTRVTHRKDKLHSPHYRTIICCGKSEKEKQEITNKLEGLFHYTMSEEKTTYRFHIVNKELTLYLMQFGDKVHNKRLTQDILNLPVDLLESFLKGYFSADGCFTQNAYKASTASKELAYGIQACVHKVFQVPCRLYSYFYKNRNKIEGRTIQVKRQYEIAFSLDAKGQEAFYEDGYIWVPFRKKWLVPYNDYVYNMEVENDNSYTVYNLIVHNCQDISVAGKAEGLRLKCNDCQTEFDLSGLVYGSCPRCRSKNVSSSTRSGLYFEGLKVLLAKKPKYSVIENVKGLTFKKNRKNFEQMLKDLEDAGYKNYWKILNAKDFGVPQNRERIFIVSIRKDLDQNFEFPEGFDSGIRLKHILEPVVDEKYYIPQDRCERLLKELKEKFQPSPKNIIQLTNPLYSQQRIYSPEGNAPTLLAGNKGGGNEPCKILIVHQNTELSPDNQLDASEKRSGNAKIIQVGRLDMPGNDQVKRVYNPEGLAPTLDTMQGGHRQPKIVTCDISRRVYVRKHKADLTKLQQLLQESRKKCLLSDSQIANVLRKPVETVKCWFRSGDEFLVPEPDIWPKLKELLQIKTDEYDLTVTAVEETTDNTPNELEFLGGIDGDKWLEDGKEFSRNFRQGNRVYSIEGIACSQTANGGGLGGATGLYAVYDPYNRSLPKDQEASTTLRTNYSNGNAQVICVEDCVLRIRKLTPLECFLLMGFDKEDYDKLREHGFSDTRLYKMAGNSIVVNVLEHIFMQLFLKK